MNKSSYYPDDKDTTSKLTVDSGVIHFTLSTSEIIRWLALGAVIGPILFTLAWIVLGFLSPGFTIFGTLIAPYSPISAGISGLGLGVTAPYMNAAFVLNGLFIIVGAVGIFQSIWEMGPFARWVCTILLALTGLGSMIDGAFTLESFMPHMIGFLLGILSTVLSFLVIGSLLRRIPRWNRFGSWLLLGSPLTLARLKTFTEC